MLTDCVAEKSVPVTVTNVPTGPEDGEKVTGVLCGGLDFGVPPQPLRTQIVKINRHLTTQTAANLISFKTSPNAVPHLLGIPRRNYCNTLLHERSVSERDFDNLPPC